MSASISSQMDTNNAALTAAVSRLQDDIQSIKDELTDLQSAMPVGSQVTQAQMDTMSSLTQNLSAKLDALDALKPPVTPTSGSGDGSTPTPVPSPDPAPTPAPVATDPNAPPVTIDPTAPAPVLAQTPGDPTNPVSPANHDPSIPPAVA